MRARRGDFEFGVRERVPLKQGLKQNHYLYTQEDVTVRERVPLKQGLKP